MLGSLAGLKVATPALSHLVVPVSLGVLIALFVLQRFGWGTIGWLTGMLVWFAVGRATFLLSNVADAPPLFKETTSLVTMPERLPLR